MRLIIAGGRSYIFDEKDCDTLDIIRDEYDITEVVSGGAKGADTCGELWAEVNEIPVTVFRANWQKHGKIAGHLRNKEMADYADAVALFPGGSGTNSMYNLAKRAGLEIFDFRST